MKNEKPQRKTQRANPGRLQRLVRPLDAKTEAAIQDRATASTRRILFPNDSRKDDEVANEMRNAINQFEADKKVGKIKPVSDRYRL
jgi:hypothetical protein